MRLLLASFVLILSGLMFGCATRVEVAETDPAVVARLMDGRPFALGGVVAAAHLDGRLTDEDATAADQALYRAFLSERPDLTVLPVPAVEGRLADGTLAGLEAAFARRGRLLPGELVPHAPAFEGGAFLTMVQITSDNVRTILPGERSGLPPDRGGAEGVPEEQEDWTRTVLTEREIGTAIRVFDVTDGALVWEATATTRDRQRYQYEDAIGDDTAVYVRDRLRQADELQTLSRGGDALQVPDLIDLLENALVELVRRLPGGS
ncbi:hypothetical protein GF314_10620 [bacterium]|nr:hypothetical protein [bacterium]